MVTECLITSTPTTATVNATSSCRIGIPGLRLWHYSLIPLCTNYLHSPRARVFRRRCWRAIGTIHGIKQSAPTPEVHVLIPIHTARLRSMWKAKVELLIIRFPTECGENNRLSSSLPLDRGSAGIASLIGSCVRQDHDSGKEPPMFSSGRCGAGVCVCSFRAHVKSSSTGSTGMLGINGIPRGFNMLNIS